MKDKLTSIKKWVVGVKHTHRGGATGYADITGEEEAERPVVRVGAQYSHCKALKGSVSLVNLKDLSLLASYQLNSNYGASLCLNKDFGNDESELKYGFKFDYKF